MASLAQYKHMVLVAEDRQANQRLVDATLQTLGIKALMVGNGARITRGVERDVQGQDRMCRIVAGT